MLVKQSAGSLGVRAIEEFLFYEAKLLDEREFGKWLTLFTKTAWYWVPISRSQENPRDTVSIIYDDRKLLETRVRRLQNPNIHAQNPPSRTSRIIGNILMEKIDEKTETYFVSSQFQMVEFRGDDQRLFAGHSFHCLTRKKEKLYIESKRVDLVNAEGMNEGITIPF